MSETPPELRPLDTRIKELQAALEARDWELLGQLNSDIAGLLEPAMQALEAGQISPSAVQKRLQALQTFCDDAEAGAREARDEASRVLKGVGRSRQAARTYASVSDGREPS